MRESSGKMLYKLGSFFDKIFFFSFFLLSGIGVREKQNQPEQRNFNQNISFELAFLGLIFYF